MWKLRQLRRSGWERIETSLPKCSLWVVIARATNDFNREHAAQSRADAVAGVVNSNRAALVAVSLSWFCWKSSRYEKGLSMLGDTSKFKVHHIVYRTASFALATGWWEGGAELRLACRWYEDGGIGYPQTFGKPQWMLFPTEIEVDSTNLLDPSNSELVVRFGRHQSDAPSSGPRSE